ncbi:MAG: DUF3147 family protein [Desulfobacteraceae bacterium]|jgi:uncharacterized membrane protein (GlpM family)
MQFILKLLISLAVLIFCTQIGKRFPSLGGLIATMPLTGLLVLVWLYSDNPGNYDLMVKYTKGALWGILPSILFFLVAYLCFERHFSLTIVLIASFGIWLVGAFVHQFMLS